MKRFLFVLLLLALLILSSCNFINFTRYSHTQTGVGCGTISVDYYYKYFPENVKNADSYQVEVNGAKFYITEAGTYTNDDVLDSKHVQAFDAASSAKVAALGEDYYRMTVSYSGLADGEYELHWKRSGDDLLTVTAIDKNGQILSVDSGDGNELNAVYPLDTKNNEYIRFRVTSNAGAPATGDGAQPLFWAIAALIGLAGIVVLFRRRVRG